MVLIPWNRTTDTRKVRNCRLNARNSVLLMAKGNLNWYWVEIKPEIWNVVEHWQISGFISNEYKFRFPFDTVCSSIQSEVSGLSSIGRSVSRDWTIHDDHCLGAHSRGLVHTAWYNTSGISTKHLLPCVTMIIPTLRKVMTPARKTITESKISALNCFFFRFEMIPAFNIFVLGMFAWMYYPTQPKTQFLYFRNHSWLDHWLQ